MSTLTIKNRLKKIENIIYYEDKDKWRLNLVCIQYMGNIENINANKKYHLEYKGKKLIYDNLDNFYKEYNIYPKKDINPQILEIVDNSHLEKVLYISNKV